MDRREFLLNTAKASGVVLPWWGLLPLTANAQQRLLRRYLSTTTLDGGTDLTICSLIRRLTPRYNLYTQHGLAIPGSGNLRWAPIGNEHGILQRFRDQMLVVNGINTQYE